MENVPKIVQARLQRIAPESPQKHPDADLLTAFAEQSLGGLEREDVMEHLARCGECREVIALAIPATEVVTASRPTYAGRVWLSWPVVRWGVVAAGILLVTSVGILQYKQRTEQSAASVGGPVRQEEKVTTTVQSSGQAIVPQAGEIAKQTPMRKRPQSQAAVAAGQSSSSLDMLFPPAPTTTRQGAGAGIGSGTGGGIGGGVFRAGGMAWGPSQAPKNNPEQLHGDAFALAPAAKEAMPVASQYSTGQPVPAAPQVTGRSANQMVEVQAESAPMAAQDQGQDKRQLAQNQMELPPQKQPLNNLDVVKAKDSVPPQAESSVAFAPMVSTSSMSLQKGLRSSPRWAISSSGALQRSFDAGQTWEDVNVSQLTPSGGLTRDATAARKVDDRKVDDQETKTKKNEKAESNTSLVFRALAALGPEVWAGGSGAMLYYSLDSGAHWARVLPTEANVSLTGDIIGVEFSDSQHARIATSTGEVWMTADHGQTWHKQ